MTDMTLRDGDDNATVTAPGQVTRRRTNDRGVIMVQNQHWITWGGPAAMILSANNANRGSQETAENASTDC